MSQAPAGYSKWNLVFEKSGEREQTLTAGVWTRSKDDAAALAQVLLKDDHRLSGGKYMLREILPGKVIITPASVKIFSNSQ